MLYGYIYIYYVNCLHLCLQNCCFPNFTKAMMKTYEKHLGCSFLAPPIYYYDSFDHGTTPQMHPNAASLKVSEAQFPSVLRNNSMPVWRTSLSQLISMGNPHESQSYKMLYITIPIGSKQLAIFFLHQI